MRLLRFTVLASIALGLGASLALSQNAEARERGRNSRSHNSRGQGRSDNQRAERSRGRSPWDWHPGMLGDSRQSWSPDYAGGLYFGYDRGGWNYGYRDDGWSAFYSDGNLRLRYSQGGIYSGPGCGVKSAPWLRGGVCQGCGNRPGYCGCDYGGGGYYPGDYYPGGYYGRQRVIVFGPGQGDGYDRAPDYGDPLYVDGQPVYPQGGDVYYDNSVTNNYYGDPGGRPSAAAADRAQGRAPSPEETLPAPRPYGSMLYDRLRLGTPDGEREFLLREGRLAAGPLGETDLVASGVDMSAGAYALIEPGLGTSLVYLKDGRLYGAFQTGKGQWYSEALLLGLYPNGAPVRVEGELSLGLVGSEMWASFSADNGARYLYVWESHAWREVGSAR